jgi:hypothetical protein
MLDDDVGLIVNAAGVMGMMGSEALASFSAVGATCVVTSLRPCSASDDGWMVMLARRKAARSAASVCAFVARRWRCPGLMVVKMYVAIGAMPPVTEVAQVMRFGAGVVAGATGGGGLHALGRAMAPSSVIAPPSEVVQLSAQLSEWLTYGRTKESLLFE